jgi:hypothetical protein
LAESNRQLADRLRDSGDFNWAIVLVFYSALHLVNALEVRAGQYSDDLRHPERAKFVDDFHPSIDVSYDHLYQKSIMCRYWPNYRADRDTYDRQIRHLNAIRGYVDKVLSGTSVGPP